MGRWVRLAAALLAWSACGVVSAAAHEHDLPPAVEMDGFLRIHRGHADLAIRVPLDLLRSVSFPTTNGNYDLARSGPAVTTALHALASDLRLWADNRRLAPSHAAGRIVAFSDRSFEDYDAAVAHIATSPDPNLKIGFELGYLDAHFTYPIGSSRSVFAIQSVVAEDLDGLVKLVLQYQPRGGHSHIFTIVSGSDRVLLDPAWYQIVDGFVAVGAQRFVTGLDNLLIVLCLMIPIRRIRPLVPIIAAFAIGSSTTLFAVTYNFASAGSWLPPLIKTAIAASIFYLAIANIVGASLRRRWMAAALFGLIYGFAFADLFRAQLQSAGSYLLVSLVSFTIGIWFGLLIVLCVFVPALALLFRGAMSGRMGVIVLSAIVADVAGHWIIDRGEVFWQTPWPQLTGSGLMVLARWVLALGLAVAAASWLSKWIDRHHPALVEAKPASGHD